MPMSTTTTLQNRLLALSRDDEQYATEFIDLLLSGARQARASDLHLHPTPSGLEVRWRIDGVLSPLGVFPFGGRTDPISRLKVIAGLLTYKQELPQEGRLRDCEPGVEMRVSTFPSLHGERAVVRIVADTVQPWEVADLGFPDDVCKALGTVLHSTSGALLMTGPTGSGKTTTAYACLREIVTQTGSQRSISTLEDPIESALDGVAQSQVHPAAGFTMAVGLRSLLRQDPEVILVGEIRDRETANVALQAALTGQLVLTTFHASSACGALSRLADMGIEDYVLRSGIVAITNQRLLRQLCECAVASEDEKNRLGFAVDRVFVPVGCERCQQTGYRGRFALAELLLPARAFRAADWSIMETGPLQKAAQSSGMITLGDRASQAVTAGRTSPAEVCRVLGMA